MKEYNPWLDNCNVVEISGKNRFCADIGYAMCFEALKSLPNVVLCLSLPHSGGHTFDIGCNRVKIAKSEIGMHFDEVKFQTLWAQYERLCEEVGTIVPTVIEWPSDHACWERPRLLECLKRNNMYCTSFDGDVIHFAPEVDIPLDLSLIHI